MDEGTLRPSIQPTTCRMSQQPGAERAEAVSNALQNELRKHGHGFQHRLIREIDQLFRDGKHSWKFEYGEYPVAARGRGTHIDFLLRLNARDRFTRPETYLVCECKRANPALSDWVFITAPYTGTEDEDRSFVYLEQVIEDVGEVHTRLYRGISVFSGSPRHLQIELRRKDVKGETSGPQKGAFDKALEQVFRGVSGLVSAAKQGGPIFGRRDSAVLLPVIFTTATLWAYTGDLSGADLETGDIPIRPEELGRVDWLIFHYNISPDIAHDLPIEGKRASSLREAAIEENLRSVAVVSSEGIADFLGWASRHEWRANP